MDTTQAIATAQAESLAPLTDRVNNEPPILKGLSASEVTVATVVSVLVWFVIGSALALFFGRAVILFGLLVVGPVATVWVSAGWLAGIKRNRPIGYYWHRFLWWLHRLGLRRIKFIDRRGPWDLGRSLRPARHATRRSVFRTRDTQSR